MSIKGLAKTAKIFISMQELRIELLREPLNLQDVHLSAMLAEMNNFASKKFQKITMMPHKNKERKEDKKNGRD